MVAVAVSESKKAVSAVAAAIVVGIGLFVALLQWGNNAPPDKPLPSDAPSLLSPYVNGIEVHNEGSAGFSISLDISSGWESFSRVNFCYQDPDDDWDWCSTESSTRSPTYRWPDSVYLAYPPEGTSTYSYGFRLRPEFGSTFDAAGNIVSSAGLAIDIEVFIEVTDGSVSAIYCWISYPSTYLGPYRLESYYPYLIYQGSTYVDGWWYSD